jgi:hypothetical protein
VRPASAARQARSLSRAERWRYWTKKPKAGEPSGEMRSARTRGQLGCHLTFSHPDYTVGPGLSPDRARHTASSRARQIGNHLPSATPPIGNYLTLGEIHPAPKVVLLRIQLLLLYAIVKGMSSRLDLDEY